MGIHLVADDLVIDNAGTDGLSAENSDVVALNGNNAVQVAVLVFAVTVSSLEVQLQQSFDQINWANVGSAQTFNVIGRKLFTTDTGVAAPYVRLFFSMSKGGKAIFKAWLNISRQ